MLEQYYLHSTDASTENVNYIQEEPEILFLEQKYGFPFGIK